MPMLATFYGGPADGGELTLAEPVRTRIRFPLTPLEALDLFEPRARDLGTLVPSNIPATYQLEMVAPGRPYRDNLGRLRYLYVPTPNPAPKETTDA